MKQLYIVVLLLCTFLLQGVELTAQDYRPLVINPKIGVNFSNLLLDENYNLSTSTQMGWNAGFDFRYGRKLLIMGGIHIYGQGAAVEDLSANNLRYNVRTSQLKIPAGLGYKIFRLDYFNIWLYGNAVLNLGVQTVADEGFPQAIDNINRNNLAGRVGIGFDISRITLELNYERSVTDFISDELEAKNQLVGLSLGFKI